MTLVVAPVETEDDEAAFFEVSLRALSAQASWRPQPRVWEERLFAPGRNPLRDHGHLVRLIARRGRTVVGRIAAWTERRRPDLGLFGFFDTLDVEAGAALVRAAADFCATQGCTRLRGPIDFWPICSAGVPIEGLDLANTFALHHGTPHYAAALEQAGLTPVLDFYTWRFGTAPVPPPAIGIARATFTNPAITVVDFDPGEPDHWRTAAELYQRCYVDNDWFMPVSVDELRVIGDGYIEPAASFLTFVRGTPAALSLGLRNVVETSLRLGDVIPPEPIQRLARVRRSQSYRQWLWGVAPQYRGRALGHLSTALYVRLRDRVAAAELDHGEAAWTHTLDARLSAGFATLGARRDKTYRVFEGRL